MLINLSSINEPDPAKFRNTFSETLTIKPNSLICLIKGQITRVGQHKRLQIEANTPLHVRWSPYDIRTIRLNPSGDAEYTPTEFVDYVKTLLPDGTFHNRGQQFLADLDDPDDDEDMRFHFYFLDTSDTAYDYSLENFLYGTPNYRRVYSNPYSGRNMPDVWAVFNPAGADVGGNGLPSTLQVNQNFAGGIGRTNGYYVVNCGWDRDRYTIPPLQSNGAGFNMCVDGQNDDNFVFNIGQPHLRDFKMVIGRTESQVADNNIIVNAGVVGTPLYHNPAEVGDACIRTNFDQNGDFTLHYFNVSTKAYEQVNTGSYEIGDHFSIRGIGRGGVNVPPEEYFYFVVEQQKNSTGLSYWCPLTISAGSITFVNNGEEAISSQATPVSVKDTFNTWGTTTDLTALKNHFTASVDGYKITGVECVMGFPSDGLGDNQQSTLSYKRTGFYNSIASGQAVAVSSAATPNLTGAWEYGAPRLQRYEGSEGITNNPHRRDVFRLTDKTSSIKLSGAPTMIAMWIYLVDDTAQQSVPGHLHTIYGSEISPIVQLSTTQAVVGYNARVLNQDGSVDTYNFQDGGGIVYNIPYATPLIFIIETLGLTFNNERRLSLYDPATGNVYYQSAAGTFHNPTNSSPIADIVNIGGINTGTAGVNTATTNEFSNMFFKDFRLYRKCKVAGGVSNTWTDEASAYRDYWDTGDVPNINWAWGGQPWTTIAPTPAMTPNLGNYANIGLSRPNENVNITFQRDTLSQTLYPTLPDITCIYAPSCSKLPNSLRTTTLDRADYGDSTLGFVATEGIQDELIFENPAPDRNENVLQNRLITGGGTGVGHPIASFDMGANDVNIKNKVVNIEITNLPHRSYNGTNRSVDKTIYQLPQISNRLDVDDIDIVEFSPATKVWCELNNPAEIPLNQLEVQISDEFGKKMPTSGSGALLKQETHLTIEIKNRNDIIN